MAADASIYSLNQPVKQANPLAQLAQAYQVQGLAAESQQAQRALQQEDALSGAYQQALGPDGKLNRNALLSSVAGAGLGAKIPALQKGFNEQDKSAREAEKAELEGVIQKFDVGSRIMSTYDPANPQTWQGVIQQTAQYLGADAAARLPMQPPTVEQIQQNMNRAMSAKDLAEQKYKALTFEETQRSNRANEGLRAESNSITAGGQLLTDTRARDANALKREENDIKRGEKVPENSTALRKEFESLPEVKNYKQALPSFKGIEDAVQRNTPMSDINIVYGIAKLYDPNSVVREGEYATVANAPAIPERIKGYAQYIQGGGKLTDEVKRQILTEAKSRMKTFEDEYGNARTNYQDIARRSNADASLVINDSFKPALKPQLSVGLVQGGYRYKGGNPNDKSSWEAVK